MKAIVRRTQEKTIVISCASKDDGDAIKTLLKEIGKHQFEFTKEPLSRPTQIISHYNHRADMPVENC